jgi:hypothetical protein
VKETTSNSIVLTQSGSDASYDLIVEAVTPRPHDGVRLELTSEEQHAPATRILSDLRELMEAVAPSPDWGLRVRLFQRIPEPWIWAARIESAAAKLEERGFGAPAAAGTTGGARGALPRSRQRPTCPAPSVPTRNGSGLAS